MLARNKWYIINSDQGRDRAVASLFFILGIIIYFIVYKDFPPYLVNDAAAEILQVRDFKIWPLKPWIFTYNTHGQGQVDVIESLYGYFMWPFIRIAGDSVSVFRFAMGLVFAVTASTFFILLRKLFSFPVAVLAAVAYLTSAYTIWWPLLLLRNAFSPLFVILLILSILYLYEGRTYRGFCLFVMSSFLAINAYSTFKAVLPALSVAALFVGLWVGNSKRYTINVLIAVFLSVCLIIIFFMLTQINMDLLMRGSYMFQLTDLHNKGGFLQYIIFFMRSFFLTLYENPKGFLAEPTHFIFSRAMLSSWLFIFWLFGLAVVFFKTSKKEMAASLFFLSLFFSSLALCFGGPSLKSHFALAPIEFIVIAYGFEAVFKILKNNTNVIKCFFIYILIVAYLETQFMFKNVNTAITDQPPSGAQDVGLFLNQHSRDFDLVIYASYGIDLLRLIYPYWKSKTKFVPMFDENFFNDAVKNSHGYKRVWLILAVDSPFYSRMLNDKEFCFSQNISGREDATLLISCKKISP